MCDEGALLMGVGELLERDESVSMLKSNLERARAGTPTATFVVGEAGLGKTSLLESSVRDANDFRVCRAHGERSEVTLPFGFLNEALAAAGFGDLLYSPSELSVPERTLWSWNKLREWIEAQTDPLLLAFDDLHWADADSRALVGLLVRYSRCSPMAIVATLRPHPDAAYREIEPLIDAARWNVSFVRLEPLSAVGSETLVERAIGRNLSDQERRRCAELCAGNPLLLEEVANQIGGDVGGLDFPRGSVSESRLLLARFAGLGSSEMDYVRAASVLGVSFRAGAAATLAGFSNFEVAKSLDVLCTAGLLRSAEREFVSFAHALFREALYEDIAIPVRCQLHAEAFEILWGLGVPAGEAARHAVEAHLVGNPVALEATHRAGIEALDSGAFDQAKSWLRASLELGGPRMKPVEKLGIAKDLKEAGAAEDALELASEVAATSPISPDLAAEATRTMARACYETGDAPRSGELFEIAARLIAGVDSRVGAETLVEGSLIALYGSGPLRAERFTALAEELLGDDIDPELSSWLQIARGQARLLMAEPDALHDLHAAIDSLQHEHVALRGYRGSIEWGPRLVQLQTAKLDGDFAQAIKIYEMAMDEARRAVAPFAVSVFGVAHADTLTRSGRLLEARETLSAAIENVPWMSGRAPWAMVGLAHVNYECNRMDESRELCEQIADLIGDNRSSQPMLRCWLYRVLGSLALHAHDVTSACRYASATAEIADETGIREPCSIPWHSSAIAAYAAAGRTEDLASVVERLVWATERVPCRWPRALLARARALAAVCDGDPEIAQISFEEAIGHHANMAMPLELVETLIPYGSFLRRQGNLGGARTHLREAVKLSRRCGATRLKLVAEGELRLAGGRRRESAARGVLTPMEKRVAELASLGLTNLEIAHQVFISPRTVEHHLSRVYANLSISSRRDLIQLQRSGEWNLDISPKDS